MNSRAFPEAKIRILRVIARLNIGGPAIHVVNLNAGLDRTRFEQLLVVGTENRGEGSMLDYALSRGVQPITIPEIINDFSLRPRDAKALVKLYHPNAPAAPPHRPHPYSQGRLPGAPSGAPDTGSGGGPY